MASTLLLESRSIILVLLDVYSVAKFIAILKTWHLHVRRYEDDQLSHPPPDGQTKKVLQGTRYELWFLGIMYFLCKKNR